VQHSASLVQALPASWQHLLSPPHFAPLQQFSTLVHAPPAAWHTQRLVSQSPVQQSAGFMHPGGGAGGAGSTRQVWHLRSGSIPLQSIPSPQHSASTVQPSLFGQVLQVFAPSGPTHFRFPQHSESAVQFWLVLWHAHTPPSQSLPSQQSAPMLQFPPIALHERHRPPTQLSPLQQLSGYALQSPLLAVQNSQDFSPVGPLQTSPEQHSCASVHVLPRSVQLPQAPFLQESAPQQSALTLQFWSWLWQVSQMPTMQSRLPPAQQSDVCMQVLPDAMQHFALLQVPLQQSALTLHVWFMSLQFSHCPLMHAKPVQQSYCE